MNIENKTEELLYHLNSGYLPHMELHNFLEFITFFLFSSLYIDHMCELYNKYVEVLYSRSLGSTLIAL